MSHSSKASPRGQALCLIALLAPGIVAAAQGASDAVTTDETKLPLVVFVGERISVERAPDPCAVPEGTARTCVSFDSLWTATYRVLHPVAGEPPAGTFTFRVADHYGYPIFAEAPRALLYVTLAPDGPYLQKYMGFPMARTIDNDWAGCGALREDYDWTPAAVAIEFVEPMFVPPYGSSAEQSREAISYDIDNPDDFRIDGNDVTCLRGIRLHDFHRWVMNGVMKARGFGPD